MTRGQRTVSGDYVPPLVGDGELSFKLFDRGDYYEIDFYEDDGNVVLIDGEAETAQAITQDVRQWQRGWFLDADFGVDWASVIGSKGLDMSTIKFSLIRALRRDPKVKEIKYILIRNADQNRHLVIVFAVITCSGQEIIQRITLMQDMTPAQILIEQVQRGEQP